tara:strand:+ start:4598 stop:4912 length:315 start_codon:yes stop_codon:yes gene_type:complete
MSALKNTHPADVVAELRKRGTSLSLVAERLTMHPSTVSHALRRCIPSANREIAKLLDTTTHRLWPEWFDAKGQRHALHSAPSSHKAGARKSQNLRSLLDGGDRS